MERHGQSSQTYSAGALDLATQAKFDAHFLKRKARYSGLPTACIQQAVRKFFGNLQTTRKNRQNGLSKARYPWRDQKRFATVPYRGNLVHWENGSLTLGGGNGQSAIVIPMRQDPGQILKAELLFDEVLITVSLTSAEPLADSATKNDNATAKTPKLAAGRSRTTLGLDTPDRRRSEFDAQRTRTGVGENSPRQKAGTLAGGAGR